MAKKKPIVSAKNFNKKLVIGIAAVLGAIGIYYVVASQAASRDGFGCPVSGSTTIHNSSVNTTQPYGPTQRQGSSGVCVKEVQTIINQYRPYSCPLIVDGGFGAKTYAAVRNFQARTNNLFHLSVDGTVGPQTWVGLHYMYERFSRGYTVLDCT